MALTLVTSDLIHGLDYSKLTGTIPTWNQNTTGSAATLTTARNIGGVSFNGSAAINLPGVNTAGNQNTSGTAAGLSATLAVGSGGTGVTSITALKNVLDDENWTFANNATFGGSVITDNEVYLDNGKYLRFERSSGGLSIQTLGIESGTDDVRLMTTGAFKIKDGSLSDMFTISSGGVITTGGSISNPFKITANPGTRSLKLVSASTNFGTWISWLRANETYEKAFLGFTSTSDDVFEINNRENADMTFHTNATERLRISSTGNVGVGTDSPTDYGATANTLEVRGVSGNGAGVFRVSNGENSVGSAFYSGSSSSNLGTQTNHSLNLMTNNSPKITILSGGNVGIGTTSPSFATIDSLAQRGIEITGTKETGTAPVIRLSETGSGKGYFEIRSNRKASTSGNYLAFGESADTFMVIRGDDDGGGVVSRGSVGIGTDSPGFYGLSFKNILTISSAAATSDYAVIELAGGSAGGGGIQFGNQTVRQSGIFSLNSGGLAFYTNTTNSGATLTSSLTISSKGDISFVGRSIGNGKNYATSQSWQTGAANTFDYQTGYYGGNFTNNGSTVENSVVWGNGPFGNRSLVWQTVGESLNDADGGWNKTITGLPSGQNHAYMSYVYVMRTSSATTGTFYYGCSSALNLNGSSNTNPYFHVLGISALPQNVWCLAVGIIQAHTDTNTATPAINGVYRMDTKAKISTGSSFRSVSSAPTTQQHRAYHYYSTNPSATLAFANPGFYVVDGSEPNLATLFG